MLDQLSSPLWIVALIGNLAIDVLQPNHKTTLHTNAIYSPHWSKLLADDCNDEGLAPLPDLFWLDSGIGHYLSTRCDSGMQCAFIKIQHRNFRASRIKSLGNHQPKT